MRLRGAFILIAFAGAMSLAVPAYAYNETGDPRYTACVDCHGVASVSVNGTDTERQGPHGGYIATSRKCKACHYVHSAAGGGRSLLPEVTITEACEICHDGTGGSGVYGVLIARGLTPAALHRVDTTRAVPGGDPVTGGTTQTVFVGGVGGTLGCIDCHSPHNASTVASFTGDRRRIATDTAGVVSNRLLKRRPTSSDVTASVYGSNWCGACHKGRIKFGSAGVVNHPSDTTATPGYFHYAAVQVLTTVGVSTTTSGTLGANNFGYVLPDPRTVGQGAHRPICQQCHEDARNVGDKVFGQISSGTPTETFVVTTNDGKQPGDNPRFQTFPHESPNSALLVETDDDLCTNCHTP
ncbi:MAG: hypothetical protein C0418_06170 [Coriobacteriaceae bacterium]|nr:hypothetical protein [Coriobacteriaceae bacterium]